MSVPGSLGLCTLALLCACAGGQASERSECSSGHPCAPVRDWMEAERTAYARAESCLAQGASQECERLLADADQVHRDWLTRYSAMFERVGTLPPWAMEEQVGAPDSEFGNALGPVWVWQWSTANRNGRVQLQFSKRSNNTMRMALYCAGGDCKPFFAR